jgi:O-antigen/teichoic acid export membrane protein
VLKQVFSKLWNSPSFTSWGSQAAQALRLLVVVPLILTSFGQPEIAAWYLFSSLLFFGEVLNARMDLTFVRMIAFAMGGATDLAPIRKGSTSRGDGAPNWPLLDRVYSTIGSLNVTMAIISLMASVGMGVYGLTSILQASQNPNSIIYAFACMAGGKFITDLYRRYSIILKGMNYVALTARWDTIFSLISIGVGCAVLKLGGDIFHLALAMQAVLCTNILRSRYLSHQVEAGRIREFTRRHPDREVIRWAAEPFFKGLAINLANSGVLQLSSVIFARYMPVDASATYLFSLRMLETARQLATVPFSSQGPKMSRLMAQGALERLRKLLPSRILLSQCLFCGFAIGLMWFGPILMKAIGANSELLPAPWMGLVALALMVSQFMIFALYVSAMANDIVCFKRTLIAGLTSAILCFLLIPKYELLGLLVAVYLPPLAILGLSPVKIAADRLGCRLSWLLLRTSLLPISLMVLVLVIVAIVSS